MAISSADLQELQTTVQEALATRNASGLADLLLRSSPRHAAEILESLPPADLAAAVSLLGDARAADVLEHLDAADAARLVVRLSRTDAADVLEEMAPDDAADVVD